MYSALGPLPDISSVHIAHHIGELQPLQPAQAIPHIRPVIERLGADRPTMRGNVDGLDGTDPVNHLEHVPRRADPRIVGGLVGDLSATDQVAGPAKPGR